MAQSYTVHPRAKFGLGAILSIGLAIASFAISLSGHGRWGLLAAMLSLPLGLVGLVSSLSPSVKGGWISLIGMVLGVFGIILAVLVMAFGFRLY